MKKSLIIALVAAAALCGPAVSQPLTRPAALSSAIALPAGATLGEARWYSEQVEVAGRLFRPSASGNLPAVVLAPGWGQTAESLDAYAAAIAAKGIVALTIDYRGWGRSGGFVYLNERLDTYDRMRFVDRTPQLAIRRGRLEPELQIQDIRNAVTFLQGTQGIDRARIGILGVDMAGGHVISALGMDSRLRAGVAVTPIIAGAGTQAQAYVPSARDRAEMIRLAREGRPPANAGEARRRNELESRLAVAEYRPFWRIEGIPAATAVQFIVAGADERVNNRENAEAAAAAIQGPKEVKVIAGARHVLNPAQRAEAALAAAEWLAARL